MQRSHSTPPILKRCGNCNEPYNGFGSICPPCRAKQNRRKVAPAGSSRLDSTPSRRSHRKMDANVCAKCEKPYTGFGMTCAYCRQSRDATPSSRSRDVSPMVFAKTEECRCHGCGEAVYITERKFVEGRIYHASCFKCWECGRKLDQNDYNKSDDGHFFCRAHFDRLCKERQAHWVAEREAVKKALAEIHDKADISSSSTDAKAKGTFDKLMGFVLPSSQTEEPAAKINPRWVSSAMGRAGLKVGDRVRLRYGGEAANFGVLQGDMGTVVELNEEGDPTVKFDHTEGFFAMYASEFEQVKDKTKVPRGAKFVDETGSSYEVRAGA